MHIQDMMSAPVTTCAQDDTLHTAARLMWENDCGAVPVINQNGQLIGIITDRDICMATYTMGRAPQEIMVSEVMAKQVVSSHVDKSIDSVERLMSDHQIRRVPIVNKENHPVGMLSLNDLTRHAASHKKNGADREIIHTMAAIGQPRAQTA